MQDLYATPVLSWRFIIQIKSEIINQSKRGCWRVFRLLQIKNSLNYYFFYYSSIILLYVVLIYKISSMTSPPPSDHLVTR